MNKISKIKSHPELVEGCLSNSIKRFSFKFGILITLLFFYILPTLAQENGFKEITSLTKIQAELNKLTENTNTIQSSFIQEKHLSFLTENIISKGEFYFKSPDKLRWEYSEPFSYLIIFNSKNIIIKDENKVSTFDTESNKMFSEINNMMIGTIQGNLFTDTKRFDVKYFESTNQYLLELYPKLPEMKDMLKTIKIFIDKSDISVAKIKMVESSDDYTSIEFKNRKLNQVIDGKIFTIK